MSIQSTTDKVADNARNLANNVLQSAQDAVQSTRDVANESLDKAETGVRHLRREASPVIDDLATRAQDLAARSIRASRWPLPPLRVPLWQLRCWRCPVAAIPDPSQRCCPR